LRQKPRSKLLEKEDRESKKAVTDADRRRGLLSPDNRARDAYTTVPNDFAGWYEWEVPFDTDPDWPPATQEALRAYRAAWRAEMNEVNACIAANAEQEELVDKPEIVRGVVCVSGPFTMEGVMPAEESPIGGAAEQLRRLRRTVAVRRPLPHYYLNKSRKTPRRIWTRCCVCSRPTGCVSRRTRWRSSRGSSRRRARRSCTRRASGRRRTAGNGAWRCRLARSTAR